MAWPKKTDEEKRKYYAIKNALTPAEKELISFYELNWHLKNGYVPTIDEVYLHLRKKFPKINHTSVSYYLNRAPVIKALDSRGIPFRAHSQIELTSTQIAVATVLANFADTRSNDEKLDSLGVNSATYYAWLKQEAFQNYVKAQADAAIKNIDPVAKVEFAKKVQEGYWPALKLYIETTGAIESDDAADPKHQMLLLIEIIQRHVKDSATLEAIAKDVDQLMRSRTLEALPGVITGEHWDATSAENDPELIKAQKMLGF